jgi:aquaporin Z
MRKYIVEFIGTFFLIFTIGCVSVAASSGTIPPLAIGAVLMAMVYAGGHVSGAHYNPAVSLAIWMRGRLKTAELAPYIVAQGLGAVAAALAVRCLKCIPCGGGGMVQTMTLEAGPSLLAEFLFTFALAYVVLNVATASATQGNSYYGLAIGFTVVAGAFTVGAVSGGAFNPAVALGLWMLGLVRLVDLWIFALGCFGGGAVAAVVFRWLHPSDR